LLANCHSFSFRLVSAAAENWKLTFGCAHVLEKFQAGLMALRERRMKVTADDFAKSKENVLYRKTEGTPEGLYL
jgi:ATP-dependent 26S proteasome regulatory subunit